MVLLRQVAKVSINLSWFFPRLAAHELTANFTHHPRLSVVLLDKLLPKLHAEGHKILIFSQSMSYSPCDVQRSHVPSCPVQFEFFLYSCLLLFCCSLCARSSLVVKMLDLISEYCEFRNYRYERLDGRVRGTERQKAIDRFEREPDSFLFLLSTRAGGVGINLTAADTCIIFDSDWNPQNGRSASSATLSIASNCFCP